MPLNLRKIISNGIEQVVKRLCISITTRIHQQELIDYINNPNGKPKVKQKCKNELTRRGIEVSVELIWQIY